MKLDAAILRYLSKDDLRVLTAVEMGLKNHELVPLSLVRSISSIRHGGVSKTLQKLCQHHLASYERGKRFDGYRITFQGYDYLALNALTSRDVISNIGNQIGVGKESDVYVVSNDNGDRFALKLHRLGRTCFRKVSEKRDYHKSGNKTNWMYLSRLAAFREFSFMKALVEHNLPIPQPIDCNRHAVVMELIDGTLLNHLRKEDVDDVALLYDKLINLIIKLANELGLVHGDFNEFNIIIKSDSFDPVIIDFPQMIPISHASAQTYFERDVNCIVDFFAKRFGYESDLVPCFESIQTDDTEKSMRFLSLIDDEENDHNCDESYDESLIYKTLPSEVDGGVEESKGKVNEEQLKDLTDEKLGSINNNDKNDDNESFDDSFPDVVSSIAASTIAPEEIRRKLKKERQFREKKTAAARAINRVKGDDCALRRRQKEDRATINDDMKAYNLDANFY